MRKNNIIIIFLILIGCFNNERTPFTQKENISSIKIQKNEINEDSVTINDFQKFRLALYNDNFDTLIHYFPNTITEEFSDACWNISLSNKGPLIPDYIDARKDRFTVVDFKKYYKKIFPNEFIIGLMSIKSDSLLKHKEACSSRPYYSKGHIYLSCVVFNRDNKSFSMFLSEDGNNNLKSGSSVWLNFDILENGMLKFKGISFAG